jgi:hypothetical protein
MKNQNSTENSLLRSDRTCSLFYTVVPRNFSAKQLACQKWDRIKSDCRQNMCRQNTLTAFSKTRQRKANHRKNEWVEKERKWDKEPHYFQMLFQRNKPTCISELFDTWGMTHFAYFRPGPYPMARDHCSNLVVIPTSFVLKRRGGGEGTLLIQESV